MCHWVTRQKHTSVHDPKKHFKLKRSHILGNNGPNSLSILIQGFALLICQIGQLRHNLCAAARAHQKTVVVSATAPKTAVTPSKPYPTLLCFYSDL